MSYSGKGNGHKKSKYNSLLFQVAYIVGTHWNCLTKAIPKSIDNMYFQSMRVAHQYFFHKLVIYLYCFTFTQLQIYHFLSWNTDNNIKFAVLYCHPGVYQTARKLVRFTMLISLQTLRNNWEVYGKMLNDVKSLMHWMYVVRTRWNCLRDSISICTDNTWCWIIRRKIILKFTLIKYHVHCIYLFTTCQEINAYQVSCPLYLPLYNMSSCQ